MIPVLFSYYIGWEHGRINMQEYQIRLEPDSAYIYDNGKLIGSCPHGNDGVDLVILKDNL